MNDNDTPRRAANGLLRQQLPGHRKHAQPHDLGTTVGTTVDGKIVYPGVPERQGSVVYEAKTASNPSRRGTIAHAEGLATRDPNLEAAFGQSFSNSRSASYQTYEVQPAGVRSPLGTGAVSGNPAWVDDRGQMFYFAGATGDAGIRGAGQPPLSSRPSVSQVGTDVASLDLRERPGNQFSRAAAFNPRRPNDAEVND
jgi:hypothetical protein